MKQLLTSLDRSTSLHATVLEPDRHRTLREAVHSGELIARGSGLSYVAASFGPESSSLSMNHFNRLLEYDESTGDVVVEAGATIGKLFHFLAGKGRMLAVQPGYPLITIGGALALNAHGKNHCRDGVFSAQVRELTLLHPLYGLQTVSREATPELFLLTCGGAGLTGVITSVRLATVPCEADAADIRSHPVRDLAETIERLQEYKNSADLLYSWNDFSLPSRQGRGHVVVGSFVRRGDPGPRDKDRAPALTPALPFPLFTKRTTRALNSLYHIQARLRPHTIVPIREATFPVVGKRFYYALYGKAGFIEKQFLVPIDEAKQYCAALQSLCDTWEPCAVLASCKLFSGPRQGMHFTGEGVCINVDVPSAPRADGFLNALDALNTEAGCISNLAKDSHIQAGTAARQYGAAFDDFKAALYRHDPRRTFSSALSRRLGL